MRTILLTSLFVGVVVGFPFDPFDGPFYPFDDPFVPEVAEVLEGPLQENVGCKDGKEQVIYRTIPLNATVKVASSGDFLTITSLLPSPEPKEDLSDYAVKKIQDFSMNRTDDSISVAYPSPSIYSKNGPPRIALYRKGGFTMDRVQIPSTCDLSAATWKIADDLLIVRIPPKVPVLRQKFRPILRALL